MWTGAATGNGGGRNSGGKRKRAGAGGRSALKGWCWPTGVDALRQAIMLAECNWDVAGTRLENA